MTSTYTCFDGMHRMAHGALPAVALQMQRAHQRGAAGPVLLFDDTSGRTMDIDIRGSEQALRARLASSAGQPDGHRPAGQGRPAPTSEADGAPSNSVAAGPRGRGRPRLGVVAREVTLLPRHWDWLAAQTGGASVALRKLVEQARRLDTDDKRHRHERAYHFMSAIAGDLPGYEEAIRALFADDQPRFDGLIGAWPEDVRAHAAWLAFGDPAHAPGADQPQDMPDMPDAAYAAADGGARP